MAQRWIIHVDMDAFFVSVEEILNPVLKGKPVIVGGDPDGRGVVAAVSYEARKYGIHSAMPLAKAKKLCPKAVFLKGRHGVYGAYSRRVFAVISEYSPDVERTSIDEGYIDMTGTENILGNIMSTTERMKEEINIRTGLNASFGISSNKLVSKIASDCAKPNGILLVLPGLESAFFSPLKIERLPGVGEITGEKLHSLGVKTIGDITRMDSYALERSFGKWGNDLNRMANGISDSPVVSEPVQVKSISREVTFDEDTVDIKIIKTTLFNLVEDVASSLREENLQAKCVSLKLRYSDFKTVTRSVTSKEPTDIDCIIYKKVMGLFDKTWIRRGKIRLVGVGLSGFLTNSWQPDLFEEERMRRLKNYYTSIDKVRRRYGYDAIRILND